MGISKTLAGLLLAMPLPTLAAGAIPQRGELEKKAFEDSIGGYRLKPPKDWVTVPVSPEARQEGLALQMEDGARLLRVVLVDSPDEFSEWVKRVSAELTRLFNPEPSEKVEAFQLDRPELDEQQEISALPVHHRRWLAKIRYPGGAPADAWIDTWFFAREQDKIGLVFTVSEGDKFARSWLDAFERSAKSLQIFEPSPVVGSGAGASYAERLEAARAEAERTPGWRVVATPSEKFILTTSSDNQKFVDEVIDRLERSRQVFEEDYPPPADFRHVSIVRLCGTEEEFHRYGKTGGGVMGWFNPDSTELVLFDAKDIDRNMSYAVMTHEAFHQYCHFLFGRSEAHRWFDEGHGDYYGGMKFSERGKPKITARMPGGLERLTGIRELIQSGTHAPLADHLNFDHEQWQTQGPGNTSCYEESWSIVYMLRQGMLGEVNPKVWRPEYARILPSYIETLRKGFAAAYEEARRKQAEQAAEAAAAAPAELDSDDLGEETVRRIWKEALDASWGKIDLARFEEDWKLYVKKYLKD